MKTIFLYLIYPLLVIVFSGFLGFELSGVSQFDSLSLFFSLVAIFCFLDFLSFKVSSFVCVVTCSSLIILQFVGYKYFQFFGSYVNYGSLSLFEDLILAVNMFLTWGIVAVIFFSFVFFSSLPFWMGRLIKPTGNKVLLVSGVGGLVLALLSYSLYWDYYTIRKSMHLTGGEKIIYKDNNPLMFFVRSSPFFPEKYKPAQEAYDSSKLDAMAAGIANGAEITLPADINPDKFLDIIPEYPGMLRDASPNKVIKYTPKNHEKDLVEQYNVIVLILESFRDYETHSPFGEDITPNLNYWSKKGARYTSFYSTNRVTVKSETAILCGVMDSQNNDHLFVRNHNFSAKCLPSIFSSNGYETLWFHGNTKKFFDRNEYIPALGYSKVFGREEFLKEGYDDKHDLGWGIPDEIVFDWALEKLIKVNKPFFAEVLSLSNHQPFSWDFPNKLKSIDSEGVDYNNYMRGINYTDRALGRFMDKLQRSSLKDNTIVVITGDHGVRHFPSGMNSEYEKYDTLFKVPLLVIGPNINTGRHDITSSHLDIAPTLLSLLGIKDSVGFLGRPLMGSQYTNDRRPIFLFNMDNYGILYGESKCFPVEGECKNEKCFMLGNYQCRGEQLNRSLDSFFAYRKYLELHMRSSYKSLL